MLPWSEQFLERFVPVDDRLAIHRDPNMPNDRGTHSLIIERETNLRLVAGVVFEDRPHRRPDLLALHVSGVTGKAQRTDSNQRSDDRVVSAGDAGSLLFRHETMLAPTRHSSSTLAFFHRLHSAYWIRDIKWAICAFVMPMNGGLSNSSVALARVCECELEG